MSASRLVWSFVAAAVLSGCRCGPPPSNTLTPDYESDPKALSFEACPVKDENGAPVKDVFPDEKTLTVKNLGKAGGLVDVQFTGPDKDAFSVVQDKLPDGISATSEEKFPVRFTPQRRGDAQAELVIDDGNEKTAPISVKLVGTGRNLPSQPTLKVVVESKLLLDCTKATEATACLPNQTCLDMGRGLKCQDVCFAGGQCQVDFPDTFFKQASPMKVQLENTGCPTLKITNLEVQRHPADPTGNLPFTIEEPGVPPTEATPILLTTADNNATTRLKLNFSPEDDGSGDPQRYAILKVATNDPANPSFEMTLFGAAVKPDLYVSPSFCNFTEDSDKCGNAAKVPNKGTFEIHNGSANATITISDVAFEKGGQGGRFAVSQDVKGQTIAPGQFKVLEVTYTDRPLFVTDRLVVSATAGGQPAGQAVIVLFGGVLPDLVTDPSDQLSFENPTDELTTKIITVKNGAGAGDLIINRVFVDPSVFFSVVEPLVPAGTVVKAGQGVQVSVRYKKPVSGGTQTGILRIDSNDPDYGPPPFKVVRLYSVSPLDQLPVAVLKGCLPSDATCAQAREISMNVTLSSLSPKQLTMTSKDSYDPGNTSPTAIKDTLFRLVRKPGNATSVTLENDGLKTTNKTAKLTLDPQATGEYVVTLLVFDDKNQQSARVGELKIFVNQ